MSLKTNLESYITRVGTEFKSVRTLISGSGTGDVSALTTTSANLVAAINELDAEVGTLSGLSTTDKTTLVAAINELQGVIYTDADAIASLLTAYASGAGTVSSADSVIGAIQKLDGTLQALITTVGALDTDDVAEATNLYYTDARAVAAPLAGFVAGAGVVAASDTIAQGVSKLVGNDAAQDAVIASLTTSEIAEGTPQYFTEARVLASVITGFTSGAGTVAATDSILESINKLDGNINAIDLTALINDAATAANTTWSSTKIDAEIVQAITDLQNGAGAAYDTLVELQTEIEGNDTDLAALLTAVGFRLRFDAAQTLTAPQLVQVQANSNTYDKTELGAGLHSLDLVAAFNAAIA